MLDSRFIWVSLTAFYYACVVVLQWGYPDVLDKANAIGWIRSLNWIYALAFAGLGIVLQGAITRVFEALSPLFWRPIMLCTGAALALLATATMKWLTNVPMSVELWLSALLGLALIAVLARLLPENLLLRWYGVRS